MRVQYTSQKKGGRTVTDNSLHLSKPLYPTRLKISHQIVCLCAEKLPFAYSGLHIVLLKNRLFHFSGQCNSQRDPIQHVSIGAPALHNNESLASKLSGCHNFTEILYFE